MSSDNFETVSFRVRKSDYAEFKRIANVLYASQNPQTKQPAIREPKVSILAKTFLYVKANEFRNIEAQAQALYNQAQAQVQGAPQ